jgi:hypothetical protein
MKQEAKEPQSDLTPDMFRQKKPCADCPFLKTGGVRHGVDRVFQYAGYFTSEPPATFPCHETRYKGQDNGSWQPWRKGQTICAGGLIFAEKVKRRNALLRWAEKLGWYKPEALQGSEAVCNNYDELAELQKEDNQ